MLACTLGDCKIEVEAAEKDNDFKVLYIHVQRNLPNGDVVAAGAISCLLNGTLEHNIQLRH